MPTFPNEENSTTHSSGKYDISIGGNIPVWKRLSGNLLEGEGWKRNGTEYQKDGYTIKYDGVYWKIGQIKFQWLEELSEYINNGKLPEE